MCPLVYFGGTQFLTIKKLEIRTSDFRYHITKSATALLLALVTMEIADVMRVCQELLHRVQEQKLMAHEDDRSHLIEQFHTYKRRNEETIQFLLEQVSLLRGMVGLSPVVESSSPIPVRSHFCHV